MTEPNNTDRADWARQAVTTYAQATHSQDEELPTNIGDLLGDLMHLCNQQDLDFEDLLENGRSHFDAELHGRDF